MRNVTLILNGGSRFFGKSFSYEKPVAGEVVFNTTMTRYSESLTDPSHAGQLMTLTYPLMDNHGVPPFTIEPNGLATFMESEKIHVKAIIVSDYSSEYSHWNAVESLGDWLKREKVPGITGIDARGLTKIPREHRAMMGRIVFNDEIVGETDNGQLPTDNYAAVNYVGRTSCKEIISYLPDGTSRSFPLTMPVAQLSYQLSTVNCQLKKIVLVDCGAKTNIIRCLLKRGVKAVRVPWDYDFNGLEFDGLFISNGPGDPDIRDAAVQNIHEAVANEKLPIFGICMGNQLLSKVGGAKIYKLKYRHRNHDQPVRMVGTERCFITSQNHGYAVDNNTLGADWEPLFIDMNGGSNEGIKHKKNPWFSAQFHPEAASGPTDTEFLFDESVNLLK